MCNIYRCAATWEIVSLECLTRLELMPESTRLSVYRIGG